MNIYLDTCILPTRKGLRGGFVSLTLALAHRDGHSLFVPQLVVDEFRNLRLEAAAKAIDNLRGALKDSYDLLGMGAIYVPSAEEVVDPIVRELETAATILPVHPDDANEALRREAKRVRPARDGRGARDAAIWLTAVRHHRSENTDGVFVTKNVDDFADARDREQPHQQLVTDLGDAAGSFHFALRPYVFLDRLAPEIEIPDELAGKIIADAELISELYEVAETYLAASGGEVNKSETRGLRAIVVDVPAVIAVHAVGESMLVKCDLHLTVSNEELSCRCWLESSQDRLWLVEVEGLDRLATG